MSVLDLIILLTLCGQPTGFIVQSEPTSEGTPMGAAPYTERAVHEISSLVDEDTQMIKIEIAPMLGFSCTKT